MSWTDDEIAEMARAGHAEQKFAYHDAFFAEVEGMLPTKQKRYFPFIVLPLLPLLGIFSYLTLFEKTFIEPASVAKTIEENRGGDFFDIPVSNTEHHLKFHTNRNTRENSVSHDKVSLENQNPALRGTAQFSANAPKKTKNNGTPLQSLETSESPVGVNSFSFEGPKLVLSTEREILKSIDINGLTPLSLNRFSITSETSIAQLSPYQKIVRWNIYVEAGAGMGQSYLNSQIGHTQSLNLGMGLRYDFKRSFVQFGLNGELQKVQLKINERTKIYHTSATNYENVFDYQSLYRVHMPFVYGYKLNRHSIQVSLASSYLVGAKMDYAYIENGQTLQSMTTYTERKGWNNFSSSVGFGYGYQLPRKLTIGANVNWQLVNQINRNLVTDGVNRPFSGQVFIRKLLK